MSLNQIGGIASKIYNGSNESGSTLEKLAAENLYLRNSCGYNGMFYSLNFSSYWNISFLVTYVLLILYFYLSISQSSSQVKSIEEYDSSSEKSNIYDKLSLKNKVKSVSADSKDIADEYGI